MMDEEVYGKLYAAVGLVFIVGMCVGVLIGVLM